MRKDTAGIDEIIFNNEFSLDFKTAMMDGFPTVYRNYSY